MLANDLSGADGFATTTLVGVAAGSDTSSAVSGGVGSGVAGTYGTLTLSADGSYTYLATADAVLSGNETDVFVYTVEDSDGDVSTTTLTISVSNSDLSGSVSGDLSTDDSAVRGGGTEGVASGNLSDTVTVSGTGGTGAGTYSYAFASGAVTAVAAGDFSINEATGEVTFTQDAAYAHASGANPQTADDAYSIAVEITDGDGNTSTVTVNVTSPMTAQWRVRIQEVLWREPR